MYCKCGAYMLWDRDHWVCMNCGLSPWRCECTPKSEIEKLLRPTNAEVREAQEIADSERMDNGS